MTSPLGGTGDRRDGLAARSGEADAAGGVDPDPDRRLCSVLGFPGGSAAQGRMLTGRRPEAREDVEPADSGFEV